MIFKVIKIYDDFISDTSNDTYVDCSSNKNKIQRYSECMKCDVWKKVNNLNFSLISIFEIYNAAKNYYSRIVTTIKV